MKAIYTHRMLPLAIVWVVVGLAHGQEEIRAIGPWRIGMSAAEAERAGPRLNDRGASFGRLTGKVELYGQEGNLQLNLTDERVVSISFSSETFDNPSKFQASARALLLSIGSAYQVQEVELHIDAALARFRGETNLNSTPNFSLPGTPGFNISLSRMIYADGSDNGYCWQLEASKEIPILPPLIQTSAPTTPAEPTSSLWSLELPGSKEAVFKRSLSSVNALLVRPLEGAGNAASAMKLSATAVGGTNPENITFGFNQAVGEDMQKASSEVVRAVQVRHGQYPASMDVKFGFGDKWGGKDGPSAAVACALLLESLIEGFEIPGHFAVTGDLNADSTVQSVGGVADKIRGAMDLKCTLIAVPAGNEEDLDDLVVEENLRRFLTAQIFTLKKLDDAILLAHSASATSAQQAALADLAALQSELTTGGATALNAPTTSTRLQAILVAFPNCYTAKILLAATQRKIPGRYSLSGTCVRIEGAMAPFEKTIQEIRGGANIANYQLGRDNPLQAAKNNLAALKAKSDPRLTRVIDAEMALIDQYQRLLNANLKSSTVAGNYLAELRTAGERSDAEWQKLRDDKEIQDQLMQRGVSL